MKIGGLTWWRNNYGSLLQAYALQQELNSIPEVSYEITFDESGRKQMREGLDIEEKFVIGHIGRFNEQKIKHT